MIRIKNLRNEKPTQAWQVKVDRTSVLGNPFYMRTEAQRNEVCDKYDAYFRMQCLTNVQFKEELDRLYSVWKHYGKLELFCWCAPKRCHAETIKKYLEEVKRNETV